VSLGDAIQQLLIRPQHLSGPIVTYTEPRPSIITCIKSLSTLVFTTGEVH
jgi:hypothetical protein